MTDNRNRWINLIKRIRQEHGVGIFEAEKLALHEPEWRRWIDRQITVHCRRMALRHIREHGLASLIEQSGDRLSIREGWKKTAITKQLSLSTT